jgi:hypothetical protein
MATPCHTPILNQNHVDTETGRHFEDCEEAYEIGIRRPFNYSIRGRSNSDSLTTSTGYPGPQASQYSDDDDVTSKVNFMIRRTLNG